MNDGSVITGSSPLFRGHAAVPDHLHCNHAGDRSGLWPNRSGIILAILQIAGVTGRLWWGWLADRIRDGNAALLMIALLSVVFALATSALTAQSPHVWVYTLMALFSFAAVGWNGVFMAEIARIAPVDATSKATGAVLVVGFAGILVGPPAFTATHAVLGSLYSHLRRLCRRVGTGRNISVLAAPLGASHHAAQ